MGRAHNPAALESERIAAAERVRTLCAELAWLAGDEVEPNGDDEHDPEGSTVAFERARVTALVLEAESQVADLGRALVRLAAGTYSTCAVCGMTIPPERLDALPATRTCFNCSSTRRAP